MLVGGVVCVGVVGVCVGFFDGVVEFGWGVFWYLCGVGCVGGCFVGVGLLWLVGCLGVVECYYVVVCLFCYCFDLCY